MKSIPRVLFAHLPTPVESLSKISALYGGPTVWIKRDDQTGLAFGGNKTRKLEFLVADALGHGAKTLITGGAFQSNHCRQTAAAAAKFGLACILVLGPTQKSEKVPTPTGNYLLDQLFNAEIVQSPYGERDRVLQESFNKAWEDGRRPYLIPYGGSNATGAAGYAYAMKELADQAASDPDFATPNWICIPSSSGGTQAGIVAGASLFGFNGKILGISIDEKASDLSKKVAALATEVCDLLGEPQEIKPETILVNDQFLGEGYGIVSKDEIQVVKEFAQNEGILLDPVYTGRAAAGLKRLIQKSSFLPEENVLFWHTGGSPALFADRYQSLI
jgi:D-cysteine desulfhydrase family pyridoxal phosphate-dependent enzyme